MHMHTLMHTMKTPRTHHVLHTPAGVLMTTTVRLTPSCETNELPSLLSFMSRFHWSTCRCFTRWSSSSCRKVLLKALTVDAAGAHTTPSGLAIGTAPKPAEHRRRSINCSGSARIVCKAH